ncbi:Flavodoxin family protein [Desulfovibrionales bacterium]
MAISGSARKGSNTTQILDIVCQELEAEGITTEFYELASSPIVSCIACYKRFKNKDQRCTVNTDYVNKYIERILAADGILLGSPAYFADVSASMKALIERAGIVDKANEDMFKRKLGAGIVAMRRGGGYHVFSSFGTFFLICQMIVVGSSYWNLGRGYEPGEVQKDTEGIDNMKNLGAIWPGSSKKTSICTQSEIKVGYSTSSQN